MQDDVTPATTTAEDGPVHSAKSGEKGWGVAARWFLFALLAVAFFAALKFLFQD